MKSVDIPVGSHVAYDRWQQRNSHSFAEAFVIAHRPRGNRSSYWGSRTGNGDTIGILYAEPWAKDENGRTMWQAAWVNPSNIHYLWADYEKTVEAKQARDAEIAVKRAADQADRQARFDALPGAVQSIIPDWKAEDLVQRGTVQIYLTVDMLEQLVRASQLAHPAVSNERVQAEVEAALALLG